MSINCYFKCVNKGWKKSSDQIGTIYCAQFWRGNESSTRQTCPVLSCPGSGPSSAKHLKSGSKEVAKWSTSQVRKSRPQNPIHPNHDSANVSLSVSSCLWPLLSRMNPPKGNTDIFLVGCGNEAVDVRLYFTASIKNFFFSFSAISVYRLKSCFREFKRIGFWQCRIDRTTLE